MKMRFLVVAVMLLLVELGDARPSRILRRSRIKGNKRSWSDSPISADPVVPSLMENNPVEDVGTGAPKVQRRMWIDLEKGNPPMMNVPRNSDITLECTAVGSPAPRMYWLKDGKPIDHTMPMDSKQMTNQVFDWTILRKRDESPEFSLSNVKLRLPLKCLQPEDEGRYTCVAENDTARLVSHTVVRVDDSILTDLKPDCFPFPQGKKGRKILPAYISSHEYIHMENIGNDIILSCHAVGRPRPRVTWLDFEGKPVINGKKFRIMENGNLLLKSLSWSDMGEYACVAENEYGSDTTATFVYPLLNESTS